MTLDRPTISTHVLDTGTGRPRAGVRVRLLALAGDCAAAARGGAAAAGGEAAAAGGEKAAAGSSPIVGEAVTDADGRIRDLLANSPLRTGSYRLEFALDPGGFFTAVSLDVRVDDAGRSYHVPLLLAPFGLTTYRGS